jgi:hypothetical protein
MTTGTRSHSCKCDSYLPVGSIFTVVQNNVYQHRVICVLLAAVYHTKIMG